MVQLVAKELILVISVVPRLREQRGATLGFLKEKSSSSASAGKDKTTSSSSSHSRGKNSPAKVPASGSSTPQTISTPSSTNSLPSFFEVKKQPIHACFSTLILVGQLFLIMGCCFSKTITTFAHNLKLRKILMNTCSSHNYITILQTFTSLLNVFYTRIFFNKQAQILDVNLL
jgi:hypothetical protein